MEVAPSRSHHTEAEKGSNRLLVQKIRLSKTAVDIDIYSFCRYRYIQMHTSIALNKFSNSRHSTGQVTLANRQTD